MLDVDLIITISEVSIHLLLIESKQMDIDFQI